MYNIYNTFNIYKANKIQEVGKITDPIFPTTTVSSDKRGPPSLATKHLFNKILDNKSNSWTHKVQIPGHTRSTPVMICRWLNTSSPKNLSPIWFCWVYLVLHHHDIRWLYNWSDHWFDVCHQSTSKSQTSKLDFIGLTYHQSTPLSQPTHCTGFDQVIFLHTGRLFHFYQSLPKLADVPRSPTSFKTPRHKMYITCKNTNTSTSSKFNKSA